MDAIAAVVVESSSAGRKPHEVRDVLEVCCWPVPVGGLTCAERIARGREEKVRERERERGREREGEGKREGERGERGERSCDGGGGEMSKWGERVVGREVDCGHHQ